MKLRLLVLLVSLCVSFVVMELGFRLLGYQPAVAWYSFVDVVQWDDSFVGREDGSFRANPQFAWSSQDPEIVVNEDGFRSRDIGRAETKKSILLVGDSFAWGATAIPITRSFADLLQAKSYEVFNLGIPGTGPTQYRLLLEKYIKIIKPGIVVVSFYIGDDFLEAPDPTTPNHPLYWVTNAGWIRAYSEAGEPLSAVEAYNHYIGKKGWYELKRFLARSAAITAAWTVYKKYFGSDLSALQRREPKSAKEATKKYAYAFDEIRKMHDIAVRNGAHFLLALIPNRSAGCRPWETDFIRYQDELGQIPLIFLDIPAQTYYPAPNCHFDNAGHEFVAGEIDAYLRKTWPEIATE